jgi:hypothetical protein
MNYEFEYTQNIETQTEVICDIPLDTIKEEI